MTRARDGILAIVAAAILATSAILVPSGSGLALSSGRPVPDACWLWGARGHDCPTCGLTRSCVALAHGDLRASLAWHPAGPLVMLAAAASLAGVVALAALRARPLWGRPGTTLAFDVLAWSCLLLGVLRWVVS
jgi:hypothetical protein